MELLKLAKRRSVFSEATYVVLNILLAALLLLLVIVFDSPLPAFILVFLGKWRILAVRPRFWFANLQTNLVDIMVGLSAVTLLWQASGSFLLQAILAILYAVWLLVLKPRSKRKAMLWQAAVSQFVAITALYSVAYLWPVVIVVAVTWLIGYGVARHVLSSYDEKDITLLSLVWGFVVAELGWITYHWTIAYAPFAAVADLKIPQVAILLTGLGYLAVRAYNLLRHEQKVVIANMKWHLIFVGLLIFVVLVWFNGLESTEL